MINYKENAGVKIYPVYEDEELKISKDHAKYLKEKEIFAGKEKEIYTNIGPKSENIVLLGLGKKGDLNNVRKAFYSLYKNLKTQKIKEAEVVSDFSNEEVKAALVGLYQSAYTFDKYLKDKDTFELSIYFKGDYKDVVEETLAVMEGVYLTKDLVNIPSIDMYPEVLAKIAKEKLSPLGVEVEVLGYDEIKALKMEAFLAVANGSAKEPKFIIMKYLPVKGEKPTALVGKGLCYDSGGYAIKPAPSMVTMKSDMTGAASVIGALYGLAKNKVKKNVIGLVAACENMISGDAYKNGDIVSSMKGLSIEVINTDAEGRLTLADALYYAATKTDAKQIIDMATLTGACIMALGQRTVGTVTNDDKLFDKVEEAFKTTGEQVWKLPIFEDSREKVKGDIADIKNSTTGGAGTITAGVFLEHFVENKPWVHLDIAGPAFSDTDYPYTGKGATGIPVRSIYEFIKNN